MDRVKKGSERFGAGFDLAKSEYALTGHRSVLVGKTSTMSVVFGRPVLGLLTETVRTDTVVLLWIKGLRMTLFPRRQKSGSK